jgi:hypothetical protein
MRGGSCGGTLASGLRAPAFRQYRVFRAHHRPPFQCLSSREQTSIIASTLFRSARVALRTWFLVLCQLGQAKTNLSALSLLRSLGGKLPDGLTD